MSLKCRELYNLLEFNHVSWCFGDNWVVSRYDSQNAITHPFHCFEGKGFFSIYVKYSFVVVSMDPRKRMASKKEGGGNIGNESGQPFTFDYVATLFDYIPFKPRRDIFLLESKEARDKLYQSKSKLGYHDVKWDPKHRRFRKRRLNFLNSMVLHQQMATLLCLVFKDTQVEITMLSPIWKT